MSVSRWTRTVSSEVSHVRGGSIPELIGEAREFLDDADAVWRIEDGAVVFERPMGETMTGRRGAD